MKWFCTQTILYVWSKSKRISTSAQEMLTQAWQRNILTCTDCLTLPMTKQRSTSAGILFWSTLKHIRVIRFPSWYLRCRVLFRFCLLWFALIFAHFFDRNQMTEKIGYFYTISEDNHTKKSCKNLLFIATFRQCDQYISFREENKQIDRENSDSYRTMMTMTMDYVNYKAKVTLWVNLILNGLWIYDS